MKKLLLSIILITFLHHAKAQWSGNTAANNAIVSTSITTAKTGLVSINDGNNNMIIAWVDSRNSTTTGNDIFVQKINKDGSLPWGAEKVVCDALNAQASISMISDGAGGAILAWGDKRSGTGTTNDEQVYGQRVKADGTIGWAANGVNLSKSAVDPNIYRRNPILEKVSATEFIVVFAQLGTLVDFFAQKCLFNDGIPIWATDTDVHGVQTGTQTTQQVLADGAGGAFVVWGDPRLGTSSADIFGQRINNNGTTDWGATGKIICSATGNQLNPVVVSDNSGGLIVAWSDGRTAPTNFNIYAQRLNNAGDGQWSPTTAASEGVLICSAANSQLLIKMINSGTDYIIAWGDPRVSSNIDIYAQKINSSGVAQWTSTATLEGVAIVNATGSQGSSASDFALNDNGAGTCWITWNDPRINTSDFNIFAQKLNSDGTASFATDGILVSNASLNQRSPVTISDGAGGLIAAWIDSRGGTTSGEIYASRLYSNGTLPVKYTSITATLNTNQTVDVNWKIASEINTEKYLVQRAGEDGMFTTLGTVIANKQASYQFNDLNPVSGHNYYQIKAVDFDGAISLSDIANIQLNSLKTLGFAVYPNPAQDVVNISLGNINSKSVKINVIDLKGAIKSSSKVSLNGTDNTVTLNVANLTSGIYIIQITNEFGKAIGVQNLIKQ